MDPETLTTIPTELGAFAAYIGGTVFMIRYFMRKMDERDTRDVQREKEWRDTITAVGDAVRDLTQVIASSKHIERRDN